MRPNGPILACLLAALALAGLPAPAGAQQRYWYDGQHRRPLWAEPGQAVRFPAERGGRPTVLPASALEKEGEARSSPVFRDAAGASGPRRALPGGVILAFPAGTDAAGRAALLARHGLRAVREIGEGSGRWLVESPPGLASLDLANRLHESGDFTSASPNWWRPRALK